MKGDFGDQYDRIEDNCQWDPSRDDDLWTFKEVEETNHVQNFSFFGVAVVEEGKSEDDKAGHHHVVDSLEIPDFEHHRKKWLPKDESFFGALFLFVVFVGCIFFLSNIIY